MKVGLVGCGAIAPAHLHAWTKTDGVDVRGVFDLDRGLADKRAKEFSIKRIYDTLDQLLDDCDVVDVCTPPQTHGSIAKQVLQARRHLLIEKPVVIAASDWDAIAAAARSSSTKLAVIHNLKFAQSVRTAKKWVDDGRIGDIIRVQREFLTSPETDRMLVGTKHWSHRLPGGRWFETLPHELYLTHWFAGAMTPIDAAIASTPTAPPGAPADEVVLTLGGDRALATIHFSANCAVNRRVFTLQGSLGQIQVDILSDLATVQTIKDKKWMRAAGRPILAAGQTILQGVGDRSMYGWRRLRGESPHLRAVHAFADYVLDRGPSPTPLDEIEYVVTNCDRIGRMIDDRLRERGKVPSSERVAEPRA